jgi:hypothetical protein
MPTTLSPSLVYSFPPLEKFFHTAFAVWNPEAPHDGNSAKECKTHSKSIDAKYWSLGQGNKRNLCSPPLFLLFSRGREVGCRTLFAVVAIPLLYRELRGARKTR